MHPNPIVLIAKVFQRRYENRPILEVRYREASASTLPGRRGIQALWENATDPVLSIPLIKYVLL